MRHGKINVLGKITNYILDNLENNIILNAFRIAINGALVKYNMVDGIMDEFEDESGVDTATSTNESYDSVNDLYSPSPSTVSFQEQTSHNNGASLGDYLDNEKRPAQSFQLSQARTITQVQFMLGVAYGSPLGQITLRIETDNVGSPSGTLADGNATKTINPSLSSWNIFTFDTSFVLAGSTTYWIVLDCDDQSTSDRWEIRANNSNPYADGLMKISSDGGLTWSLWDAGIQDLAFKIQGASGVEDMTLISNSTEAEQNPDEVRIVIMEKDTDVIGINVDYKAYCSRDSGANWVQAILTEEASIENGVRVLIGTADVSGQASDKTMKWKITTLNNLDCDTLGVGLLWD